MCTYGTGSTENERCEYIGHQSEDNEDTQTSNLNKSTVKPEEKAVMKEVITKPVAFL